MDTDGPGADSPRRAARALRCPPEQVLRRVVLMWFCDPKTPRISDASEAYDNCFRKLDIRSASPSAYRTFTNVAGLLVLQWQNDATITALPGVTDPGLPTNNVSVF